MLANNALTTLKRAKNYLGIKDEVPPAEVEPPGIEGGEVETPELASTVPGKISIYGVVVKPTVSDVPEVDTVSDDDLNLVFLINAASDVISKYCSRRFELRDYSEMLKGADSVKLVLSQYPILELKNLEIGSTSIDVDSIKVMSDTGILYRPNGGFPSNTISGQFMRPNFDNGLHNVFVEYSAGYVLPKDETPESPRTLPYNLELACFKIIANMVRDQSINKGEGSQVIKSESLGDWSASYDAEIKLDATSYLSTLSPDIQNLLSPYKQSEFYI